MVIFRFQEVRLCRLICFRRKRVFVFVYVVSMVFFDFCRWGRRDSRFFFSLGSEFLGYGGRFWEIVFRGGVRQVRLFQLISRILYSGCFFFVDKVSFWFRLVDFLQTGFRVFLDFNFGFINRIYQVVLGRRVYFSLNRCW